MTNKQCFMTLNEFTTPHITFTWNKRRPAPFDTQVIEIYKSFLAYSDTLISPQQTLDNRCTINFHKAKRHIGFHNGELVVNINTPVQINYEVHTDNLNKYILFFEVYSALREIMSYDCTYRGLLRLITLRAIHFIVNDFNIKKHLDYLSEIEVLIENIGVGQYSFTNWRAPDSFYREIKSHIDETKESVLIQSIRNYYCKGYQTDGTI